MRTITMMTLVTIMMTTTIMMMMMNGGGDASFDTARCHDFDDFCNRGDLTVLVMMVGRL